MNPRSYVSPDRLGEALAALVVVRREMAGLKRRRRKSSEHEALGDDLVRLEAVCLEAVEDARLRRRTLLEREADCADREEGSPLTTEENGQ